MLDSSEGSVLVDGITSFPEDLDGLFTQPIDCLPEVQNVILDSIGESYAITEEAAASTDNHGLMVSAASDAEPDAEPMNTTAQDH